VADCGLSARLLSSSGGWSQELPLRYPSTQEEQIDQAWRNIVTALKEAGAAPEHIFKIASFHRPMSTSAMTAMTRNMERLLPNRRPIWTSIEVIRLAFDDMAVEIEVTAHVPPSFQA
jgi:enamine deaminase RidA (YjgF/YER057c/UK114 family)